MKKFNPLRSYIKNNWTILSAIQKNVRKQPNNTMLLFEDTELTWDEFDQQSDAYAYEFLALGLSKGDSVALILENRLEFLTILIGLSKIGVIAGLINNNLKEGPLIHCINEIGAKKVIFGEELTNNIDTIRNQLPFSSTNAYLHIKDKGSLPCPTWATSINSEASVHSKYIKSLLPTIVNNDTCCYIFTSGTTGLPKASKITHDRWYKSSFAFKTFAIKTKPNDRYYLCLPLFHSNALFVGFGSAVLGGASIYLRRKFSANNFLMEARKYNTNTFIYIGEICRYLLHTESLKGDSCNPIQKCAGNGLRPEIWEEFKDRFGIKHIGEFYGSTEGNVAFMNFFNKKNTIGISPNKFKLVKYDILHDEITRTEKGFCQITDDYDTGLLLSKISRLIPFEGYTRQEDTEKKILKNVFKDGDAYFNTGDLIKRIPVGFSFSIPHYQFVDRIGDTYRWKGENISTTEIEGIINEFYQIEYSNVYGVELKDTNGQAGMAAITLKDNDLDISELSNHISTSLPDYAKPLFLRVLNNMNTTGTYKMLKGDLKEQAYHLNEHSDLIYVLKPNSSQYSLLDGYFYSKITTGSAGY